jgi:hypothetical protein
MEEKVYRQKVDDIFELLYLSWITKFEAGKRFSAASVEKNWPQ